LAFLTIFTAPKPFTTLHIEVIQRNAIQSWLHLGDQVEVFLIGNEPGMKEVASEFDVNHLPNVKQNELGTPLVSSIFDLARRTSQAQLLAYLNADILVMSDFLNVAHQVSAQARDFLVIGQRWDLDIRQELDFHQDWEEELRGEVKNQGKLHPPAGSDYFIFPRHLSMDMPDFAIGRAGWDNWMIYRACQLGWEVISATQSLMVVHQNHDYSHLPGGQLHYDLDESRKNATLGGGLANMYTVMEANKILVDGKILDAKPSLVRILRRLELWLSIDEPEGMRWFVLRRLKHLRRKLVGSSGNDPFLSP
jgi:hypothetical protein